MLSDVGQVASCIDCSALVIVRGGGRFDPSMDLVLDPFRDHLRELLAVVGFWQAYRQGIGARDGALHRCPIPPGLEERPLELGETFPFLL